MKTLALALCFLTLGFGFPTAAANFSSLEANAVVETDGRVKINWQAQPGETYLVEYKTNLNQPGWDILGGAVVATDSVAEASDSLPSQGFYRIWSVGKNIKGIPKPSVKVVVPAPRKKFTNAIIEAMGTVKGKVATAATFFQLNNGPWTTALTTNDWTNWFADLSLIPGTNTFKAYAVNSNGQISVTNNIRFMWAANYAFDYRGTYPPSQIITYADQSKQLREASGFPGQVQLFVRTNTHALTVQSFAQANGGSIVAQIPAVGYYLASVTPGTESNLIAAANENSMTLLAIPNGPLLSASAVVDLMDLLQPDGELPAVPNLKAQVGTDTYLYVNDSFESTGGSTCDPPIAHGVEVDNVASRNLSGTGQQMESTLDGVNYAPNDLAFANTIALSDLAFNNGRGVINLSQQGRWYYDDDPTRPFPVIDANGNDIYQRNENNYLWSVATHLHNLPAGALNKVVFVVSAGNGYSNNGTQGVDLSLILQALHVNFPDVFGSDNGGPHMIVVGGDLSVAGCGAIAGASPGDEGFNYASVQDDANGDPLMVYAPGRCIAVNNGGCTSSGTSFAAPAVSGLIAEVLSLHPDLTVAQVTHAFMEAARANTNPYWIPTLDQINAVLAGPPPPVFTLTIGSAGTGSGTVTASPPGPTYTNGTIVMLTAVPASGSTFAGWSGDTSGTATTVKITIKADESVTATFNLQTVTGSNYSGTWTGQFSMQYTYYDASDNPYTGSRSFTFSMVLKAIGPPSQGQQFLEATEVSCDDPYFGCQGGCVPNQGSSATLPSSPSGSTGSDNIEIFFPNGTVLYAPPTGDPLNTLAISSDGSVISATESGDPSVTSIVWSTGLDYDATYFEYYGIPTGGGTGGTGIPTVINQSSWSLKHTSQ